MTINFSMRFTKRYRIIIYFLLSFQFLIGQDLSLVQYTEKDGLPSSKTYDIVQDSTGLLWIGTENGLVTFDGDEFVTYSHPDLLDNDIIELSINRNGRVYFLNLSEQLGYIENEKMVFIKTDGQFDRVRNLYTTQDKDFIITLVNRKKRVYEFREGTNKKFEFIPTEIFYIDAYRNVHFSREGKNEFVRQLDSTILRMEFVYNGILTSINEIYIFSSFYGQDVIFSIDPILSEYIRKESYLRIVKHHDNFFIIKKKGLIYYEPKTESFYPFFR